MEGAWSRGSQGTYSPEAERDVNQRSLGFPAPVFLFIHPGQQCTSEWVFSPPPHGSGDTGSDTARGVATS